MKIKILLLLISLNTLIFANFDKEFTANITGNVKVIGNTVLYTTNTNSQLTNADVKLKYVDIDNDSNTFNSSSATINSVLNGVDVNNSKIVWAGLYWSGFIHSDNNDIGIDNQFKYLVKTNSTTYYNYINTENAITNYLSNQQSVKLKIDNEDYVTIKPDRVNLYLYYHNYWRWYRTFYVAYSYNAFADVTSLLKNKKINHTYTIANISTREGKTTTGTISDGLGNSGAWTLVVAYKNEDDKNEKIRNISVFDDRGDSAVNGRNSIVVNFDGFMTPKAAPNGVDSKLSLYASEGDRNILGDGAVLTNEDGYSYQLPQVNSGKTNYFDSSIVDVPNRNPFINNNQGIDIHTNNIGTEYGSDKPIKINQSSAKLTLSTGGDVYYPIVAVFSTQLYKPNVCYDYAIMDGNYTNIPDNNRTFTKYANGKPLKIKVTIRSQESDFDLTNSKMQIKFTPNKLSYIPNSAKYTLPNVYAYEDALEIDSQKGIIAVGENPTEDGGTISTNQTIYTIQSYNSNEDFNGTFDIYLESKVNFDQATSVKYTLSTKNGLKRCPANPTYNPVYWRFNIEKPNVNFNTQEDLRYSLPTRVAGKPYNVSIASYKKDSNGRFTQPNRVNANVELEIINSGTFENNNSAGFDTVCEDPSSITKGVFVKLNNQKRKILRIPEDYPTYPSNLALKNTTFRMWVLTKKVRGVTQIVNHNCQSQSSSQCFDRLYKNQYSNYDKKSYCKASCSNSSGQECYQCLKKYFARPVCARDNFAIRPKSYSIVLSDNNQTNSNNKVFIKNNRQNQSEFANIAAGYLYNLDINATNFLSNSNVYGYYFQTNNFGSQSILKFNDSLSCNDKNNKNLNINIFDGITYAHSSLDENTTNPTNGLIVNNTGKYKLHIEDSEWTVVDQVGYQYKPFPNIQDCIPNQSSTNQNNNLNGCVISSNSNGYSDINIYSHPYKFDFNTSLVNNKQAGSNFIYSSNLSNTANNLKENVMAIKSNNRIVARGKNGVILSNYTNQCSAKNLSLKYDFITNPNHIKNIADNNLSIEYFSYVPNIDSDINVSHNFSKSTALTFSKRYFDKNATGLGVQNNYFNIQRSFNKPMNPFKITFNTIYLNTPEQMIVDLNQSYKPDTQSDLNKSFFVYYGRVASDTKFYDDVTENSVNTPMQYQVFCDENLTYCKDMGINVDSASTSEYNWWINTRHTFQSGRVGLTTDSNLSQISTNFATRDFNNGIDNSMQVDALSNNRPYVVKIKPANNTINNTPWLLYNPNSNSAPSYLFRVRFVSQNDMWSGLGDSGFSTDVNSSIGRKNKKIDW